MGRGAGDRLLSGGEVQLVSRNDKDMATSYPELAALAGRAGPGNHPLSFSRRLPAS